MILYRSLAAALISLAVSATAIVVAMGVLTWLAGVIELKRRGAEHRHHVGTSVSVSTIP